LVIWLSGHLVIWSLADGMTREVPSSMSTQSEGLKIRSMMFAVAVLRLIDDFPRRPGPDVVARQLAKSATSVAANYRAACTARSRQEFVAKLGIVVEEADESEYWLDVGSLARFIQPAPLGPIRAEARELRAIFAKSLGTARANLKANPPNDQMTK
jgi:four helix bundle protein